MSETTLHSTPRMRDVCHEQIRLAGLSLRREALVLAVVLGIVSIVIVTAIVQGNAATWFDSDEWAPIGVGAFLYPLAMWRRETRFGPAFLWTLPVGRVALALAKVFADWVWLMAAIGVFFVWQATLGGISGVEGAETLTAAVFPGATATYLFGSALVLGFRHPLRWLVGTAAVFFLLGFFSETVGRRPDGIDTILTSTGLGTLLHGAVRAWLTLPSPVQYALFVVAGVLALSAAVSRHSERRRP